eukprot:3674833-Alexandrium_andersonii.AAC.1
MFFPSWRASLWRAVLRLWPSRRCSALLAIAVCPSAGVPLCVAACLAWRPAPPAAAFAARPALQPTSHVSWQALTMPRRKAMMRLAAWPVPRE